MRKLTTQEFIDKAKKIHGDKYGYSKVEYIKSASKVCIICSKHGEFWQIANAHLQGQGCPRCTSSKGELYVENILRGLGVQYQKQYPIKYNNTTIHSDFLVE